MTSFKKSRTASFAIIVAIYVLAAILGIIVYKNLNFAFYINLLIADVAATAFVFLFSVILKNASVYDPYWSVQPPVSLACLMIESGSSAAGIVIISAVSVWAIRLTANWAYTFGDLTHQDWRYTMLSEKCGAFYPIINFLGIHLVPTLVVYLCVLPAAFVIRLGAELSWVALFPLKLSLFATAMQGIADFQMHKFRKSRVGGFIREGLWRYSRHPNYLGEILMWWGVGIYSVILLAGYAYLLVCALANTLLFTFVSIPMAEKKQARKNGFDEYKRQTRFLLPVKK